MNGLRVLHVTNMFPSPEAPASGAFVATQVRSLQALGVECDVHIIRAGHYASAVPAIRRVVRQGHYDVVHAHYGLSGWTAAWQPLPLVVTFAGSDLYGVRRARLLDRCRGRVEVLVSHWAAFRARRVIVMSARMIHLLRFSALRAKARVLPYGIDTRRFSPGSRPLARRLCGLDPTAFVIFWPHRDTPIKRRDLAEAAVRQLQSSFDRPVLLWSPSPVPESELPLRYRAADCILVVSDTEGSPTVVKEALSAALPVVAVDVGDVWDWISDVAWCARVQRDPRDIARALATVAQASRPASAAPCVERFDVSAVATRLVALYHEVLS